MRILIVDDHDTVRKSLRRLLTAEGWDVCGEATDGLQAIDAARSLQPDLILIDLFMPAMSGLDAARQILAEFPETLIMLMTSPDPEIAAAARDAGISAMIWKGHSNFVIEIRALMEERGAQGTAP